ncbi:hypothetical protein HAX54_040686 [Datura stramonium]|uniref:DUF569 domain-containing protein n=1 Tax=Datura stramonium TaxID=4076 RepID=A0ABS8SKA5_DATST|nr:hypothetical protein [Datura stramonium]
MEFFCKAKVVRLKSHLDKYLVADDDQENIRQSRNGSSRKARWLVELVDNDNDDAGNSHFIRLKSISGKYLTASDEPFLLGMTGKKPSIPGLLKTEPSMLSLKLPKGKGVSFQRNGDGVRVGVVVVSHEVVVLYSSPTKVGDVKAIDKMTIEVVEGNIVLESFGIDASEENVFDFFFMETAKLTDGIDVHSDGMKIVTSTGSTMVKKPEESLDFFGGM